jgi:unsaturated rhamnogalacturonyl hydrolase
MTHTAQHTDDMHTASGPVDGRREPTGPLALTLDRVFRHTLTLPTERLSWEKTPALTAMIRSGDPAQLHAARAILRRSIATQTSDGHLNYNDVQHFGAGHSPTLATTTLTASLIFPLVQLYEVEPHESYRNAALRQADAALATRRTGDGGLSARSDSVELWVDWVYMLCPSFAALGEIFDDAALVDEAFRQHEVHVAHLVDPAVGLVRHAWRETPNFFPQSTFWSRGAGWLGIGSIELLRRAPDHPGAPAVRDVLSRLAEALLPLQDTNGFWRHVLDDPAERFEVSGTLMHATWLALAVELGLLNRSALDAAERAVGVVSGLIEPSGAVTQVAVPPGGPGVPYGTTAFGQGFYLQAVAVLDRLGVPVRVPTWASPDDRV